MAIDIIKKKKKNTVESYDYLRCEGTYDFKEISTIFVSVQGFPLDYTFSLGIELVFIPSA